MARKDKYIVSTCVVALETRVDDATTEEITAHESARKALRDGLKELVKQMKASHPDYAVQWDERGVD